MAVTVHGTLQPDGSLKLDQVPNLPAGPVVVTVQPALASPTTKSGLADLIDEIRNGQQARGFQERSGDEIEAIRQEGEAEYEQRMQVLRSQTIPDASAGGS